MMSASAGRNLSSREQNLLIRSGLLLGLERSLQTEILGLASLRRLNAGALLFRGDQTGEAFFFLLEGRVWEYYDSENGNECLRRVFHPGQYIGLHLLALEAGACDCCCAALSACRVLRWDAAAFTALMEQEAALARRVSKTLACQVEIFCRHACICRKARAASRVAGYLLSQCHQQSGHLLWHASAPESAARADLRPLKLAAAELSLARETFSRCLRELRRNGLIRLEGGTAVLLDVEALKAIADADPSGDW